MKDRSAADELYEHRNDEGEWSAEAVAVDVQPSRTSVISFRLPREELDALEDAAERVGESISEYVRHAVTMRLQVEDWVVQIPSGLVAAAAQVPFRSYEVTDFHSAGVAHAYPWDYSIGHEVRHFELLKSAS